MLHREPALCPAGCVTSYVDCEVWPSGYSSNTKAGNKVRDQDVPLPLRLTSLPRPYMAVIM